MWPTDSQGVWQADSQGVWPAESQSMWPADSQGVWPADFYGAAGNASASGPRGGTSPSAAARVSRPRTAA